MKEIILNQLISKMKTELHDLEKAAKATKDYATDQEFKSESKYDTRSIEAGYLADAELKRVEDLKLDIQMLEEVDLKASERLGEICIGSLIDLRYQNQDRKYFLIPTAGGTMVEVEGKAILVVSVFSPLGDAVLGLKQGDEFEVETLKRPELMKSLAFNDHKTCQGALWGAQA